MRRKDREVKDKNVIFDILKRCHTIRIAMQGDSKEDGFPYVVPVSFGMEVVNDLAVVYFHCAKEGLKLELLEKNPKVCVEGDIFIKTEQTEHGITTRYESVIGFGECRFLENQSEIIHGLALLTGHYGYVDYPLDQCKGLEHLLVGKIVLDEIYGKQNLG